MSGSHGQLVDIRDVLRPAIKPGKPLVMLCPHADDGAITAACLLHEYAVRLDLPVIEVLVFSGERNVAAPWLNDKRKVSLRESEFGLECNVLGAEAVCWELDAYRSPGYVPTQADFDKIVSWFSDHTPGAIITPPATDAHLAHRMTRRSRRGRTRRRESDRYPRPNGLDALGTACPDPMRISPYDGEAERTKEWAIHCHASQVLLTDYTEFCSHMGRAYAALVREWAEGHSLAGRGHRIDDRFVGAELFQVESFEPNRGELESDPIQLALGILKGELNPPASRISAVAAATG